MTKMKFELTEDHVSEILHMKDASEWHAAMLEMFPEYEIDTRNRVAGFLAQTAHESANYKVLSENLNYSAKALDAIFGKYFKRAGRDAKEYHRQPEKIANVIYANRMDNGNTASGDGWRYRGGGILQLTGKWNYSKFASAAQGISSAKEATEYVRTPKGAIESACWFWATNDINIWCDTDDIVSMTKRINGGTIGLADRKKHYIHALEVLGGEYKTGGDVDISDEDEKYGLVRKGSKGDTVKKLQKALGIKSDGDFGDGTEAALKSWQRENGCIADGVAGPQTLGKLFS